MEFKSAEDCIACIIEEVNKRKMVDYGDKKSVREYNASYDKLLRAARCIDEKYPDKMNLLTDLFYHLDVEVVLTSAPLIFLLKNGSKEKKQEAIGVIRKAVENPAVSKSTRGGFLFFLSDWERKISMSPEE